MMTGRQKLLICVLVAEAVILFIANLWPGKPGSMAFEEEYFPEAFRPSMGWPFRAIAHASEKGVHLVDASVVLGGVRVYRDIFKSDEAYPHLAIEWTFIFINLFVATAIMVITVLLLRHLYKRAERYRSNP